MLIEDVACPVNKLADMTVDLVEMFQKFGYKDASCFGHALEGNLHLVFSQVSNARLRHIQSNLQQRQGAYKDVLGSVTYLCCSGPPPGTRVHSACLQ